MMRIIFFVAIFMLSVTVKAQTASSFGATGGTQSSFKRPQLASDTSNIQKKWFVTKYAGISTGFIAFRGGSGSFLSAPLGLQLNRQLSNNFYAFGSVSVAPYLFHYNNAPYQPAFNKNNPMQLNNFNAYSDARIGVMYINDDKTFSISGSIGVSRGAYNTYSPFYNPVYPPVLRHNQ